VEPRQSMTRYAGVLLAVLLVRVVTGGAAVAAFAASAVLLAGLILEAGYRIGLHGAAARPVPTHRRDLDRIVRLQWGGAGMAGVVLVAAAGLLDLGSIDPHRFLGAVITLGLIAIVAIFISSLIDWYWILPRVSGILRPAPCEATGGQLWARVTGVWLFHRAVATLIVTGSLTGLCLYMGQTGKDDDKAIWFIVGGVFAAATLWFNSASLRALQLAFNPKRHVGDLLDIHGRKSYIVDVSLQGAKYMLVATPRSEFVTKRDGSFALEDFGRYEPAEDREPPCTADVCGKINWYCRCNPEAHT
jgi:hypothetical protein